MSRRSVLGVAGAAVGGGLAAPSAIAAPQGPLTATEYEVIAAVARVGASYPIPFPTFGEAGTALSRASSSRVPTAAAKAKPQRLAAARAGVRQLTGAGLGELDRKTLVPYFGEAAGAPGGPVPEPLLAVAALAISTVSSHFDPNSDHAATRWIDGMRRLHARRAGGGALGGGGGRSR